MNTYFLEATLLHSFHASQLYRLLHFRYILVAAILVSSLLLLAPSANAQEEPAEGGTLPGVTITEAEARNIMKGLFDVTRLSHTLAIGKIARDERLTTFTDGFVQRNNIEVLTIGYIDSDHFWPRVFREQRLGKIEKAPTDNLLAAKIIFMPDETDDGTINGYHVTLELTGKSQQVYELLQVSREDIDSIANQTSQQQLGTPFATPSEAKETVVNALIAALEAVENRSVPIDVKIVDVATQNIIGRQENSHLISVELPRDTINVGDDKLDVLYSVKDSLGLKYVSLEILQVIDSDTVPINFFPNLSFGSRLSFKEPASNESGWMKRNSEGDTIGVGNFLIRILVSPDENYENGFYAIQGFIVEESPADSVVFTIELFEGTEEQDEESFLYITGASPPVMPDIRIKVSGNAESYQVKLIVEDVIYKRVNSNSPWILRRNDEASFPTDDDWEEIDNEEIWDVDFGAMFRGGKAYAIARNGEVEDTLVFHIRGTNPDVGLIQAYQATIPDGGAWYFPRMLRQESTFRQFNNGAPGPNNGAPVEEGDRSVNNGGRPNWGPPYGWGLKQLDNLGATYGYLTTFNSRYGPSPDELWNWQANQRKGVEFFNGDKLQAAQNAWEDAVDLIEGWELGQNLIQDNYPMMIIESLTAAEIGTIVENEMIIGTVIYSSHHRNLPPNNVSLLIADALKRYNGGRYYTIQIPTEADGRNPGAGPTFPIWQIDKTQSRGNQQADYVQEISTTTGW